MTTLTKPSCWKLALEMRAGAEWASHWMLRPTLSRWPRGKEGVPVLVLPGLATSDLAMLPMRQALCQLGYHAYPWELGFNTGPTPGDLARLAKRVRQLHAQHQQPVALVGWSLGGAMAKAVAARCPNQTRCVIAIGSPLSPGVATHLGGVFSLLSGKTPNDPDLWRWMERSLRGVPLSSIASVDDGLLASQSSRLEPGRRQENILVRGVSHLGIPAHPFILWLVHERLRQGKRWKPYAPRHAWEKLFLA